MALCAGLFILLTSFTAKHEYYVSVGEMSLNPQSKQLEFAIRVFTDDLEYALAGEGHRGIDVLNDTDAGEAIENYFLVHFKITNPEGDGVVPIFVGYEGDEDGLFVYLQTASKFPIAWDEVVVFHDVLMDYFPDQINILHYGDPDDPASYRFDLDDKEQEIDL